MHEYEKLYHAEVYLPRHFLSDTSVTVCFAYGTPENIAR